MPCNVGRTFKSSSFLSPSRGNTMQTMKLHRSLSSSSAVSSASSSSLPEEQFILSGCNTPATEKPPTDLSPRPKSTSTPKQPGMITTNRHLVYNADLMERPATARLADSETSGSPHSCSRPIAIELPNVRRFNTAPVYTPPPGEPLSARGDIQGAYFPHHENPESRIQRPHPFTLDQQQLLQSSRNQAVPEPGSLLGREAMSGPAQITAVAKTKATLSTTNTPITSYMPSGVHDTSLPMGKYYPSNYEKRAGSKSSSRKGSMTSTTSRPSTSAASSVSVSSTKSAPVGKYAPTQQRDDFDVKSRLQQYQRDMIAQATLAATQVLGSALRRGGSAGLSNADAAKIDAVTLRNIQLGGTMISSHKPIAPRLLPLGSPGPVTPMELEGNSDGWLSSGRTMLIAENERQREEVERVLRAEQERRNREGASSPFDFTATV